MIKKLGFLVVGISPSLMIFLVIEFIKSNHYGIYPEEYNFKWIDWVALIFAAAWQVFGLIGLLLLDKKYEEI